MAIWGWSKWEKYALCLWQLQIGVRLALEMYSSCRPSGENVIGERSWSILLAQCDGSEGQLRVQLAAGCSQRCNRWHCAAAASQQVSMREHAEAFVYDTV